METVDPKPAHRSGIGGLAYGHRCGIWAGCGLIVYLNLPIQNRIIRSHVWTGVGIGAGLRDQERTGEEHCASAKNTKLHEFRVVRHYSTHSSHEHQPTSRIKKTSVYFSSWKLTANRPDVSSEKKSGRGRLEYVASERKKYLKSLTFRVNTGSRARPRTVPYRVNTV